MKALKEYRDKIRQRDRFRNVKGKVFDPMTGWNPGYRVMQQDLMSAIPTNPFEEIHSKADIPIGTPHPAELDGTGFMPFKWTDFWGTTVFAHPIIFE